MTTNERIYDFICEFNEREGYAPTVDRIRQEVGLASTSTVYDHLLRLTRKGKLRRLPHGRGFAPCRPMGL